MTSEHHARSKGYEFTGAYFRKLEGGQELAKAEAKSIRASGFRACIAFVPGERRDGFAVYAEKRFFEHRGW